jgi:hypothetical protein
MYIADSGFIKISVGLLLLRITPQRFYRYIIHTSIGITAVWTLITFLVVAFQCRPLSLAWDPTSGPGSCMDPLAITQLGYAFSALDIGSDWLYAILPVAMLWDVQMTWRMKLSVCIVLSLGVM